MLRIAIPDDYQDAVRTLDCFGKLAGHSVSVYNESVADLDALVALLQDADALVLIRERTAITAALLDRLPRLRFISQTGRGASHIDLKACTERRIAVAVGVGSPVAPAELTWALIMASIRRIPQEVSALKAGRWQAAPLGVGLYGRMLGIFGYGSIGTLIAHYGAAFGMRILVWGREGSRSRATADGLDVATSQHDLFSQSDVLSIHVKLSNETRGLITLAHLTAMKPSALVVNTSRAELIAPDALVDALRAGRPSFAAVDVYESEPVISHPLLLMDNVICTPHLGYVERDSYELYFGTAFDNLNTYFAGKLVTLANPEVTNRV
ncbi:MAG: D-2-hydroxyacid dehydrogenase family protein [Anaerolineae bacterium]|nr:D-2-hydroxyacid dehydrogenase family protein [Anaerolineae bacterium]